MIVHATFTAWDLVGFEGNTDSVRHLPGMESLPADTVAEVRIVGGRALYDTVQYFDETRGTNVTLGRLNDDLSQVIRYVDPDTVLEVVSK